MQLKMIKKTAVREGISPNRRRFLFLGKVFVFFEKIKKSQTILLCGIRIGNSAPQEVLL